MVSARMSWCAQIQRKGWAMATTSLFMEETAPCAALHQPLQTCPEVLSTIYTAHYRHVLQVCRRFFRQPEDAEDAAAEVFLKLHTVLETRDEAVPFRPWVSKVAGRHCIDKLRRRKREKDSCGKIQGAARAALLQTDELLRNRARTENAASCGQNDDLSSQRATAPQFATRAVR